MNKEQVLEMLDEMELVESYDDFDRYEGNGKRYEVCFDDEEVLAVYEIDDKDEIVETIYEAE